jgi:hypothetical protein
MKTWLILRFSLLVICFFILSCNQNNSSESKLEVKTVEAPKEHLLFVGKDTLKLIPLYDTLACQVQFNSDTTKRFKTKGLTIFVPGQHDTIPLKGYGTYYGSYSGGCYNDCDCIVIDTTHYPLKYLAISRFLGKITPNDLIKRLESRFELISPQDEYVIQTLRFKAYYPGDNWNIQWPEVDLPLDSQLKDIIKKNFKKNTYIVLKVVIVKDKKGDLVRVNPNLCWLYGG